MLSDFQHLLDWFWWVPLLVGLSLIFAVVYYRRRAQQLVYSLQSLYELNQKIHQDALHFIEQSWPILVRFHVCQLKVEGYWFGEPIAFHFQSEQVGDKVLNLDIKEQDIEFQLCFYLSKLNTEQALLNQTVVQTFYHLLQSNARLKQVQVLSALNHLERYQLHLQHDLKNVSQGVQLIAQQLEAVEPEQCSEFVSYLKITFPLIGQQLRTLLKPLTAPQKSQRPVVLMEVLNSLIDYLGLKVEYIGCQEVALKISEEILKQIFENLLTNFKDHVSSEVLQQTKINIQCQKDSEQLNISIFLLKPPEPSLQPERLFEPFWTTSNSGMGLGLFLVRELLKEINGQIQVTKTENSYGFKVIFPYNACNFYLNS